MNAVAYVLFVLFVTAPASSGTDSVGVAMQEFGSQANCEAAKTALQAKARESFAKVVSYCQPK